MKTKKKTEGWKKIIGAVLIVLVLAYLANTYILKNKTKRISDRIEKPEPQFVKEGTLTFLTPERDTIRVIDIEIADDPPSRQQGLMYRSSMPDTRGMLFVFKNESKQSFWMKNTKMSLDILYVSADREIVDIYKHTMPYSTSPIPSGKPAMYVVELAAGFCDRHGIKKGDRIAFKKD